MAGSQHRMNQSFCTNSFDIETVAVSESKPSLYCVYPTQIEENLVLIVKIKLYKTNWRT